MCRPLCAPGRGYECERRGLKCSPTSVAEFDLDYTTGRAPNQNCGKWLTPVRSEQRRQPFAQGEKQKQTRRDHRRR